MADIPSLINTALDAVVTQILADIEDSRCQRASWLVESPEQWYDRDGTAWPTGDRLTVLLIDGTWTEPDKPTVHEYDRLVEVKCPLRFWTTRTDDDRTQLSLQRVNDARSLANAVEAVGAANSFSDGWTVDWGPPVRRLDGPSNMPPYAAGELTVIVTVWE